MSYPVGGAPSGAFRLGTVKESQDYTEDSVKGIIRARNIGPWEGAQSAVAGELAPRGFVNREVVRLDNRIDQIVYGDNTIVQMYTYSESAVWEKPPGAKKIVVNVLAGSSGGGKTTYPSDNYSPGQGGFSGGWSRGEFDAANVPATVTVTVGVGGAGATTVDTNGAAGQGSSFGTLVSAGGAGSTAYGSGNITFRMRGGLGGGNVNEDDWAAASPGSDGSYQAGGRGGARATNGENGASIDEAMILGGQIGMGSSGGGGGQALGFPTAANGGRGGHGGWPSGAGGGGGGSISGSSPGNGGNGAVGAVWVEVYLEDTAGIAPSAPTNVTASNITQIGATITWTASTDDIAVLRYEILRDGTQVGSSSTPTFDLTGLNAGTTYQITVRAVDLGSNKSPESTPLSLTTLT